MNQKILMQNDTAYCNMDINDMEGEIWKEIPQFEGISYCSNLGRIKKLKGRSKNKFRIIKQLNDWRSGGYQKVMIMIGRKPNHLIKIFSVHRLVAKLFIENKDNKPEVNHKFGIKTDNRASQLEWMTRKENMAHANDVLDANGGTKHFRCKFKEQDVIDIFYSKLTNRVLGEIYGVSSGVICSIKNKKSYKTILKNHNIEGRIFNSQKQLTVENVLGIYNSKLTYSEIANNYNIRETTVFKIKSGMSYIEITGGKRNTNPAHNTKLSEADVISIRSGFLGTSALCLKYGMSRSAIKSVKNKKTYKWI